MGFLLNFTVKNTVNSAKKWMPGLHGIEASEALMQWVATRRKSVEIIDDLSFIVDEYQQETGSMREYMFRSKKCYQKGDSLVPSPATIIISVLHEEMTPNDKTYKEICDLVEELCVEFL
jgi:hypothetical protein